MIPAGAIPSVLGKRRMQTAEELVNSPGFHLGGGGGGGIKGFWRWKPWAYPGVVLC